MSEPGARRALELRSGLPGIAQDFLISSVWES
jgi:hypothetical protein